MTRNKFDKTQELPELVRADVKNPLIGLIVWAGINLTNFGNDGDY